MESTFRRAIGGRAVRMGEEMRRKLRVALAAAGATAMAWLGPVAPARAVCTPPAGNNVTATCTGTTVDQNLPNGYGTGTETNLTTTVVSGASVTGGNSGISFATGSVTNSGTITGIANDGVLANNSAVVTNSGTIAGGQIGIVANVAATVTNSGTITGGIEAIFSAGSLTVTNSGTISGVQDGIVAVVPTVTNSGTITGGQIGIVSLSTANVVNSGVITGGQIGIASLNTAKVTNSGLISGGIAALQFGLSPDTLTLLPGSTIIGAINLGGGGDTVNFRTGNQNLTFDTLAGATVTSTVPFAVSGTQVATVDPTPFAMLDRNLMDFSRAVSQAIPDGETEGGAAPAFAGPASFLPTASPLGEIIIPGVSAYAADAAILKAPMARYGDGTTVWARGFAGERVQEADDVLLHTVNRFYGGLFGGDWQARPDLRLGVFLGAGEIRAGIDHNFGETRSTLVFGGLYGRYDWGASFLKLRVQGGHSSNDATRVVNNNLAPGGIETATASFDGWYVSPEASLGHRFALGAHAGGVYTLIPSLTLRYLHASFDGYAESGTTAPLAVGARAANDFEERGEVKLMRTQHFAPSEALTTSVYGGVLADQRAGDSTVSASLLGQAIPFALPGRDDVWGAYGGAELAWQSGRVGLFAAAQYLALSDSSSVVSGRGGLRIAF